MAGALPITEDIGHSLSTALRRKDSSHMFHGYRLNHGLHVPGISSAVCSDRAYRNRQRLEVVSTERQVDGLHVRRRWDPALKERLAIQTLNELLTKNKHVYVTGYCNCPGLEDVISEVNASEPGRVTDLTPPSSVKSKVEDKHIFGKALEYLGLPTPRSVHITVAADTSYHELKESIGERLVLKKNRSWAGTGISIVSSQAEFEAWRAENVGEDIKVEEYIAGVDTSMLAVGFGNGRLLLGPLNIQIVGADECTTHEAAWCGNDYTSIRKYPLIRDLNYEAASQMHEIWQHYMFPSGLIGMWGMDFRQDCVRLTMFATDPNARMTGQTPFLTALQQSAGIRPLIDYHMLALMGYTISEEHERQYNEVSLKSNLDGSLIVGHSLDSSRYCKVEGKLTPGTYCLVKGKPFKVSDSVSLSRCHGDEFVLAPGVPLEGTVIEEGFKDELFRIMRPGASTNLSGSLIPDASDVVRSVYDAFQIRYI